MGEKYHAVFYTFIDSILIGVNWRLAQVTRSEPSKYSNSKNVLNLSIYITILERECFNFPDLVEG